MDLDVQGNFSRDVFGNEWHGSSASAFGEDLYGNQSSDVLAGMDVDALSAIQLPDGDVLTSFADSTFAADGADFVSDIANTADGGGIWDAIVEIISSL